MIKKERRIPRKLLMLDALNRRISINHSAKNKIKEEVSMSYAGFRGEQSIDYQLTFIDNPNVYIFHDIRLQGEKSTYFQVDNLLLTQNYCLILEVKNIRGTLFFDKSFNQLIRTDEQKEIALPDPISQIKRQQSQLKFWLEKNKIAELPIHALVIISSPSTLIKSTPGYNEVLQSVIHSAALPLKLLEFERIYKDKVLAKNELNKVSRLINKQHIEHIPDLFAKFKIEPSEVLTGIHCPTCSTLPMKRIRGGCLCTVCLYTSKSAYLPSLLDYLLLHGKEISNKQCREYLHINSISVATKLLHSLNLQSTGTFKDRMYELNFGKIEEMMMLGE